MPSSISERPPGPDRSQRAGARPGRLRLATRGSPLALRQTELVAEALRRARPGLGIEPVLVETTGDRHQEASLDRIGGQGVFVKEVQAAVLEGRADAAVHSAKDLPSVTLPGLRLAAVPTRADPRDALVGARLDQLGPGARVATGSARRRAQLAALRPDLSFVELRGNMARRLSRAEDGSVEAVVAAAAALDRLGWAGREAERLSPSVLLPQAGQGSLALECRIDDEAVADLLALADDAAAHAALLAERAFLAAFGTGCTLPVAAWARPGPTGLVMEGMVASGDGRIVLRKSARGVDPEALGQGLAEELLGPGGGSVLELAGAAA